MKCPISNFWVQIRCRFNAPFSWVNTSNKFYKSRNLFLKIDGWFTGLLIVSKVKGIHA